MTSLSVIGNFDDVNSTSSTTTTATNSSTGSRVVRFSKWYAQYHGYASVVVCTIGIVSSLFVILILTRKHMINSTNLVLTALATFDLLTMTAYVPFSLHYYCLYGISTGPSRDTLGWARFQLFYANFSVTTHTASIWLTVALSAYRYWYIRQYKHTSNQTDNYTDLLTAVCIVSAVLLFTITILIPNFASLTIEAVPYRWTNNTVYLVTHHRLQRGDDDDDDDDDDASMRDQRWLQLLSAVNFWIHALAIKLVPCVLMSVFGILLLVQLHRIHRKGAQLRSRTTVVQDGSKTKARNQEHSRTTAMLIAVIVLFQLTELPQGLLALCSGLEPEFFDAYYAPLGDVMDILALVNNSINFSLYCTMSRQFRETLLQLLHLRRWSDL